MNVLIDDDRLIHMGWTRKAASKEIPLRCFFSIEEFLSSYQEFDSNTAIYIDSDFKNGIPGEVKSEEIFKKGFVNLYLVTGYTDLEIASYPWLKGISGKKCPL